MRVFYDRLIDDHDRNWFRELIVKVTKDVFGADFNKIKGPNDEIIFCSFSDPKSLTKPYVEWINRDDSSKIMNDYLDDYNQMTTKPMSLVLFQAAYIDSLPMDDPRRSPSPPPIYGADGKCQQQ